MRLLILGLVSAGVNLGLLATINFALKNRLDDFPNIYMLCAFLAVVAICFVATLYFQNTVTEVANQILYDLELSIIHKVKVSTFKSFKTLGSEKIYTALREAEILGKLPDALIGLINSFVMIICGMGYLFWISPGTAVCIIVFMGAFLSINMLRSGWAEPKLTRAIYHQNSYYSAIDDLLYGFKQLKVSQLRANNLFERHISRNRNEAKNILTDVMKVYNSIRLSGSYCWYLVIGCTAIAFAASDMDRVELASLLTTILFLISPASSLVSVIPLFGQAKVAFEHIRNVENALISSDGGRGFDTNEFNFTSIRFENVRHSYGMVNGRHFVLNLEDFSVERGEVVFITGTNGSGKTTLLNILTGLICPQEGTVFVNGEQLGWDEYRQYANSMAVVFSDQFLFKNIVDDYISEMSDEDLGSYAELLNLKGIVGNMTEPGIGEALSKGQQKRLQLLYALCENKQILVLDEWAAEQDSINRSLFYSFWLEAIRARGTTIIVISHDNEFFSKADRVVTFESGKIRQEKLNAL